MSDKNGSVLTQGIDTDSTFTIWPTTTPSPYGQGGVTGNDNNHISAPSDIPALNAILRQFPNLNMEFTRTTTKVYPDTTGPSKISPATGVLPVSSMVLVHNHPEEKVIVLTDGTYIRFNNTAELLNMLDRSVKADAAAKAAAEAKADAAAKARAAAGP